MCGDCLDENCLSGLSVAWGAGSPEVSWLFQVVLLEGLSHSSGFPSSNGHLLFPWFCYGFPITKKKGMKDLKIKTSLLMTNINRRGKCFSKETLTIQAEHAIRSSDASSAASKRPISVAVLSRLITLDMFWVHMVFAYLLWLHNWNKGLTQARQRLYC